MGYVELGYSELGALLILLVYSVGKGGIEVCRSRVKER